MLSFLAPDQARALTLATALWGALAAGILSLAVYRFNRQLAVPVSTFSPEARLLETANVSGGWLAGLSLALAPLVWSQAIIIEIYSLNLLLLAELLLALVWLRERPESRVRFYTLALVAGLGLGHHRTAVFSLLAVAVFIFFTSKKEKEDRKKSQPAFTWPQLALSVVLLGLAAGLPSLLVLSRGGQNPASNWDNLSWSDPAGFFQYLTGGEYRNLLFAAPPGQDIGRVAATAGLLFQQFGPVGLALGWVGLVSLWAGRAALRPFAWLVTIGLVGHLFFAAVYAADNSQVYLLPFFAFWAVAAGFGLTSLIVNGVMRWPQYGHLVRLVPVAILILAAIGVGVNYARLDLSYDHSAETWARAQLDAAPAGSILVTSQDSATFAMWYVQHVQHYRPEINVIESRLLADEWYRTNVARLYPDLNLAGSSQLNSLITANPSHNVRQIFTPQNQNSLP